MPYVDGFVIPIPKKNLDKYRRVARQAGKLWKEHGALEYCECVGDDLQTKFGPGFLKGAGAKKGETVIFSWIVFRSKAHRDRVNAKVMKDPRIAAMCELSDPAFDCKRVFYGGFKTLVKM